MTLKDLRGEMIKLLADITESPAFEADMLLSFALGLDKTGILTNQDMPVSDDNASRINLLCSRRLRHEPLQYLLGEWEFYSLPFIVGAGVLIPRSDTELLVDLSLEFIKLRDDKVNVLDLCAGSGCIAVAVDKNSDNSNVLAVDFSEDAISYATANIMINDSAAKIHYCDVLCGIDSDFPEIFKKPDLIISNPPYIRSGDIGALQPEVCFEPKMALDGDFDGLKFYRAIAELWIPLLNDKGAVIIEIGDNMTAEVCKIFDLSGFQISVYCDINGTERAVMAKKT